MLTAPNLLTYLGVASVVGIVASVLLSRRLLQLPEDAAGKSLGGLGMEGDLREVLSGKVEGGDRLAMWQAKILVINRMPMTANGRLQGSVTALRDHTELLSLQHELDVTRNTTSALRAQAYEFLNRLHVISRLVQLGDNIASRIAVPAMAALDRIERLQPQLVLLEIYPPERRYQWKRPA